MTRGSDPLIEYRDVHVSYGTIRALQEVSFAVPEGTVTAVLGANGAGKSTLANATAGLLADVDGQILFEGRDVSGLSTALRIRSGIALVPEGRQLFDRLTVRENLELGARHTDVPQRIADVIRLFPVLDERADQLAGTLSGGEQQMLAIGRALMSAPRLLILDEPSSGLAPAIVETLVGRLREIQVGGTTIVLIEQNLQLALDLADRLVVLAAGRTVSAGPQSDYDEASLRSAYFGRGRSEHDEG